MLLGAPSAEKIVVSLPLTPRRHRDKNQVCRSDFVRARAVAFDENRLPVSKDMGFFDERIGGAAETVTVRAQLNTACIVSIRRMSLHSAASLRWTDQALMLVGLHEGLRGARCRTVAEAPAAQPGWQPHMRAQIVAFQQLRDIEAGCAVGVALGGVMVAARRDTVGCASFRSPAHLIASRGARGAYAYTRSNACARRAGTPPFQSAPRMLPRVLQLANRWRVSRERRGRAAG
ncbi:hypothetical protein [Burkholderia ambifaria]|uniref:hypothetical protein n=1 Tax=Burkholderia ambifaria TaxID=152480 RepID=UPI001589B868|nr:hypothetical protein [Burkholderia ambifaria]